MAWLACLIIIVIFVTRCGTLIQVEIGVPGFLCPGGSSALAYNEPAFEAAVEECNHLYSGRFNFTMTVLPGPESVRDPPSLQAISVELVAQWYYNGRRFPDEVSVIITPGPLDSTHVHELTAHWNIPYFTTLSSTQSNFVLIGPPALSTDYVSIPAFAAAVVDLMSTYSWTSLYMAVDMTSAPVYTVGGNEISSLEKRSSLTIRRREISAKALVSFGDILVEFRSVSRIFLFLGRSDQMRRFLIEAETYNMTDGTFVYVSIYVPLMPRKVLGNLSWEFGDIHDQEARRAFQSLLIIQPLDSFQDFGPDYYGFGTRLRRRARELYNTTYTAEDQSLMQIMAAYCTVKMYSQVLNGTLDSNGLEYLRDGRALSGEFLNRTFQSGFCDMYIDRTGIRRVTLTVTHFIGPEQRQREAFLIQSKADNFKLQTLKDISSSWPGSTWPPPNEPHCGYDGSKLICQPASGSSLVTVTATTAMLLILIGGLLLVILHIKRNADRGIWWRLTSVKLVVLERVISLND